MAEGDFEEEFVLKLQSEVASLKEQSGTGDTTDGNPTIRQYNSKLKPLQQTILIEEQEDGTVFRLDDPAGEGRDVMDSSMKMDEFLGVKTIMRIHSSDNKWREYLRDTGYFIDLPNTTATTDTTAHTVTFTNGEILTTKSIYKGALYVNSAMPDMDEDNIENPTNLSYEVSADGGSNWTSVNNATYTSFSNTGTDLRFRITASGTAKIHIEDRTAYGTFSGASADDVQLGREQSDIADVEGLWDCNFALVATYLDDITINGLDGTVANGITFTTGVYGALKGTTNCLDCSANSTSYVEVTNAGAIDIRASGVFSDGITMECWINPDSVTGTQTLFYKKDAYRLYLNGDKLVMALTDSNTEQSVTSSTALSTGTWYHVAGNYDQSDLKVYINGTEDADTSYSGDIDGSVYDLYFGSEDNIGTNAYDGKIDMLRISDTAVTTFPKVFTGGSAVDSSKSWTKDLYAGYTLKIVAGTGLNQTKKIIGNDNTSLYVDSNWSTALDNTSEYIISTGESTSIGVKYTLI